MRIPESGKGRLLGAAGLEIDGERGGCQCGSMIQKIMIGSDILGGEPVFAGMRVPVRSLFDHFEGGESIEDFLEGFPSVKREQVIALRACTNLPVDTSPLMPAVLLEPANLRKGKVTTTG